MDAQVVRESDVKSIAGILNEIKPTASWTFKSAGNEILFATLDADIYRMMTDHGGHEPTAAAEPGGGGSGGGGKKPR